MLDTFSWTDPRVSVWPYLVVAALLAWYLEAVRHCTDPVPPRQRRYFYLGLLALLLAGTWPLAELARTTSLLALVLQRELLVLAVAPLCLLGLPVEIGTRLTRPPPLDWLVVRLSRPISALILTTVLLGITAIPFSVAAAADNSWIRLVLWLATLVAGLVLWNPLIRRVAGVPDLPPFKKAAYALAQSLAPTYLSFAWILAPHVLYHSFHGQRAALAVSAIMDQHLSGYLAKLGTFGVLWPVAYYYFSRGMDSGTNQGTPLLWMDVERQLERAHRQQRRSGAAPPPG